MSRIEETSSSAPSRIGQILSSLGTILIFARSRMPSPEGSVIVGIFDANPDAFSFVARHLRTARTNWFIGSLQKKSRRAAYSTRRPQGNRPVILNRLGRILTSARSLGCRSGYGDQ